MGRVTLVPASEAKWGRTFTRVKDKKVYMRVRPVSYLLNSELVQDTLNSAKLFVVEIASGDLKILPPDEMIEIRT